MTVAFWAAIAVAGVVLAAEFAKEPEIALPTNITRTGKRFRPKTAVNGKRYLCAKCRKRSPRPVKTPAPWYCPRCLAEKEAAFR